MLSNSRFQQSPEPSLPFGRSCSCWWALVLLLTSHPNLVTGLSAQYPFLTSLTERTAKVTTSTIKTVASTGHHLNNKKNIRKYTTTVRMSLEDDTSKGGDLVSTDGNEGEIIGQMRGGLIFLKTPQKSMIVEWYQTMIGMEIWLEQPNITVLCFGNLLIGFHYDAKIDKPEGDGMYTFVYPTKEEVDIMYQKFIDNNIHVDGPPRINKTYQIYQFFATDPENRKLEFQAFLHPLKPVSSEP